MKIFLPIFLSLIMLTSAVAITSFSPGPATNSGDGVSDGSGWADDWFNEENPGDHGSAPDSGDGIPDGSGW